MARGSILNKQATIYHYQLVRKIPVRKEIMISHICIAAIFIFFQLLMYGLTGVIAWGAGLIVIPIIHYAILRLTMIRVDEPEDQRWNWRIAFPWVGYVPIQMVEHGLFRRLHRHLLGFGLCAIAVVYPWASEPVMISLICWHFWFLAPRLVLLRRIRKERRDGVLKLLSTEISFYHR